MKVAVPWLQHSQRFGHCALSQTVCNRKSEISALVEKKTGFDGNRTLIHGGFCAWCNVGSIFAQDIRVKVTALQKLQKLNPKAGPLTILINTWLQPGELDMGNRRSRLNGFIARGFRAPR